MWDLQEPHLRRCQSDLEKRSRQWTHCCSAEAAAAVVVQWLPADFSLSSHQRIIIRQCKKQGPSTPQAPGQADSLALITLPPGMHVCIHTARILHAGTRGNRCNLLVLFQGADCPGGGKGGEGTHESLPARPSMSSPSSNAPWLGQTSRGFPWCKHPSLGSRRTLLSLLSAPKTCAAEPRFFYCCINSIIDIHTKRRRYKSTLFVTCHLVALLCSGVLRTESLAWDRVLSPRCTGCGSLRESSGRGSTQALDDALAGCGLKIIFSERRTEAAEKVGRAKIHRQFQKRRYIYETFQSICFPTEAVFEDESLQPYGQATVSVSVSMASDVAHWHA